MNDSRPIRELTDEIIRRLKDRNISEYSCHQLESARIIGHGGSGAKANVYWKELDDGQLVAVKCLSKHLESVVGYVDGPTGEEKRKRVFQYFERECILWHQGSQESTDPRSSKIVRLLGFTSSYNNSVLPALVLDLYPEGDLRSFISRNITLLEKEKLQLLMDVASGLAYLHEPHLMIVHRDIKGRNILVRRFCDGRLSAAIGDFGSAKFLDPQAFPILNSSFSVSIAWTPPEYVINGREDYSKPTIFGDVWSFACTVVEIMSNSDPWLGVNDVVRCLSGEIPPPHPPRPGCFREDSRYWTFVRSCFLPFPEERPTGRILEKLLQGVHDSL